MEHSGILEGCPRDRFLSHVFRVLRELAQFGCLQGSESKAGWEQPAAASESL